MFCICFSCLIPLAKNYTLLNKCSRSGHPCLTQDLREKIFSFSPFSMMLAFGLLCMAFIILRYVPSILNLFRVFTLRGCWLSSNAFFASIEMSQSFITTGGYYVKRNKPGTEGQYHLISVKCGTWKSLSYGTIAC
jgi:hypothetical protein